MTQYYIGFKQVEAWQSSKDGRDGYMVKYKDGYTSWCPADVFEGANLPMGSRISTDGNTHANADRITLEMVDAFIAKHHASKLGDKTTVVMATLANGFEMVESSSCVDPANYDEVLGESLCLKKIKDRVWQLLGFALQCARYGVER